MYEFAIRQTLAVVTLFTVVKVLNYYLDQLPTTAFTLPGYDRNIPLLPPKTMPHKQVATYNGVDSLVVWR